MDLTIIREEQDAVTEFEQAYEKYQHKMCRAVRKVGVPPAHVWDCVQEAGARLSQMQTISYVEPDRVEGLFYKTAENVGRDFVRRMKISKRVGQEMSNDLKIEQQASHRKRDRQDSIGELVHRSLSQMSELDAYMAWHYYGMQASLQELGENLVRDKGIKWETWKIHRYLIHTVKPQLKKVLVEQGYGS